MKILAIETSCDETGITILEAKGAINNASFKVLANNISSQIDIHKEYGGVYPMLAKREHIKNLPILLGKSLKQAFQGMPLDKNHTASPVDLIVVTSGPGLEPALWTGIVFAKELGVKWKVPVLPVNHMQGHILSVFGKNKGSFKLDKVKQPVLSLLVSGGHTELVLTKDWNKNKIIGQTLDDAAGEAFDKVARMLGLPYPGGPEISKLAKEFRDSHERTSSERVGARKAIFQQENMRGESGKVPEFPRPMLYSKNFDFSFSGLKTSVLYFTQKFDSLTDELKKNIAFEFENAVVDTLVHKTKKAAEKYKIKTLIVGGGVAGNKHLQKELKKNFKGTKIYFPGAGLSTDNSIMIGMAGYLNYLKKGKKAGSGKNIKAEGNLKLK
jgi:N6-L-threonylcarbamoyladenine synthase